MLHFNIVSVRYVCNTLVFFSSYLLLYFVLLWHFNFPTWDPSSLPYLKNNWCPTKKCLPIGWSFLLSCSLAPPLPGWCPGCGPVPPSPHSPCKHMKHWPFKYTVKEQQSQGKLYDRVAMRLILRSKVLKNKQDINNNCVDEQNKINEWFYEIFNYCF